MDKNEIPNPVFCLDDGTFGTVFKLSNGLVGKRYKHSRGSNAKLHRDAVKEIAILTGMLNDNIIKIHGAYISDKDVWCVLEFAEFGSLYNLICQKTDLTAVTKSAAKQMLDALAYTHSRNVVHRDIKPGNFLVTNLTSNSIGIKLADFGSALLHGCTQTQNEILRTDPITTMWYRAPEIAFGLYDMHGFAMDMWAVGLIICELCCKINPVMFNVNDDDDLAKAICIEFGTPTRYNNLMPSFYLKNGLNALPPCNQIYQQPTPLYYVYNCEEWACRVLSHLLVLEPTKRFSATTCSDMISKSHPICPKTPKLVLNPQITLGNPHTQALRCTAGDTLFEVCVDDKFDRRTFHTAARLLDMICDKDSPLTEQNMFARCAAVCSIANKLCESSDMTATQKARLNKLGNYITPEHVRAEEIRILEKLSWNVWDVTVLDVQGPGGVNLWIYAYVVDLLVARMGTNYCNPYEMAEIAEFVAALMATRSYFIPLSVQYMDQLDTVVDVINSTFTNESPVRTKYVARIGNIILTKIGVNCDMVKWF